MKVKWYVYLFLHLPRYITLPAQATSYKIGEMKIRAIRQKREKELGPNFDLGAFHRHVLTCIGPIEMLEECILEEEQLPFPKYTEPRKEYSTTEQSTKTEPNVRFSTTSNSFTNALSVAMLLISILVAFYVQ